MGDLFKEQIVKRESNPADTMKMAGIVALAALLALASFFVPVLNAFAPVLALAIGFAAYYILSFFKREYEYTFTNGSLDIDVIYAKSRRKRVFTGELKDFEIMARVTSELPEAAKTFDYSSGTKNTNTYAFLTVYNNERVKIIIEPNEMMRQAFATVLSPRKFKRD